MKAIPVTPLTLGIARRIIWFEPPDHALADPIRFMAYGMTYARRYPPPLPVRRFTTRADGEKPFAARNPDPAKNIDLDDQRRAGRESWQEFRKHQSAVPDLEEVRR